MVSDQFDGISDMLYEMARDIETDSHFDNYGGGKGCGGAKILIYRLMNAVAAPIIRTDKIELKLKKAGAPSPIKLQIGEACIGGLRKGFRCPSGKRIRAEIYS